MSPALFQAALYASLALCALGLLWRIRAWSRIRVGADSPSDTPWRRLAAVFRAAASILFSRQLPGVLGGFFLDVLLLRRLFASEKLRWLAHLLIAAGFTALLLMHAMAAVVTENLFPGYQSTQAPYLFLRNFFGAMVLVGLALFLFGRWRSRSASASVRRPLDALFVTLLGFVLVTGFMLEAGKIASPRAFYRMTEQFIGSRDPAQLEPLRSLWASEFGVAFDDMRPPITPLPAEAGRKLHDEACAACHAKPVSAFVSYPLARVLAPASGILDRWRADVWLLYLHVFACFLGLASLPFTRFFHVIAAPLSLLVSGAAQNRAVSPAGRAAWRALTLDACVRCGICDLDCSVAPLARYLDNPQLLPSHKLLATGGLAKGRLLRPGHEYQALRAAEGAWLCTDCGRCTSRCPVGLNLADLWEAGRHDLTVAGYPAPAQWVQARPALAWAESLEADQAHHPRIEAQLRCAPLSDDRRLFSRCVQCQTCTNVCPVVAHSMDGDQGIDLTPQKVMNLLRLGLRDLTLGSRMVWDCATCYQCQEFCPEGIRVADIMCELRALAVQRLGRVRYAKEAS